MPLLDDILGNQELGDDFEITLGDKGAFKLGDLRARDKDLKTRLDSTVAERDSFRTKHDQLSESLTTLLGAADRLTSDNAAPIDPRQAIKEGLSSLLAENDPADALFEDKLFGSALTKVEERAVKKAAIENQKLAESFSAFKDEVQKGFAGLANAQIQERAYRWYQDNRREIPNGADGKPLSLEAIHRYAAERNMVVPNTNLIDFDRALDNLTEPQRVEARMSEAEKRGYEKGIQAARSAAGKVLPFMTDRSAGGLPKEEYSTAGKSQRQILRERIAQGLTDPEVMPGQ